MNEMTYERVSNVGVVNTKPQLKRKLKNLLLSIFFFFFCIFWGFYSTAAHHVWGLPLTCLYRLPHIPRVYARVAVYLLRSLGWAVQIASLCLLTVAAVPSNPKIFSTREQKNNGVKQTSSSADWQEGPGGRHKGSADCQDGSDGREPRQLGSTDWIPWKESTGETDGAKALLGVEGLQGRLLASSYGSSLLPGGDTWKK